MLINFFFSLKEAEVPVTIRELLDLLNVLDKGLVFANADDFYLLSRAVLVKDEKYYDKFDRAFAKYFNEMSSVDDIIEQLIPDEWLRKTFEKQLSEQEKADIKTLKSLEELIEQFKERLKEQKEKHEGGNKWIGTGGTSPFGQQGYHPEGIRVGPNGQNKKAVKVWEKREFKDLDDSVQVGTRNISMALRRLRKFARTGATEELDLPDTIRSTAKNAGFLDLKMRPERHHAVKVLLFFDVGGSMDPFIRICEGLFSAARSEFKHMEYFYFHNFIYESVWKNGYRRESERTDLDEVIQKFSKDYKVIFIGDASMSPYEIMQPGGSVEHWNEQAGVDWFKKITQHFDKVVWLNPLEDKEWDWTQSIDICQKLVDDKMYPLTIEGLESSMHYLSA